MCNWRRIKYLVKLKLTGQKSKNNFQLEMKYHIIPNIKDV